MELYVHGTFIQLNIHVLYSLYIAHITFHRIQLPVYILSSETNHFLFHVYYCYMYYENNEPLGTYNNQLTVY